MEKIHKRALFLITITVDIILYYCWSLEGCKWAVWEKRFALFVLSCHSLFYFALYYENRPWLDVLHFTVLICPLFGFFISNIKLLSLILSFMLGLQVQWLTIDKCILNTDEQNNHNHKSYLGKIISILTIFYSCILSYKIGALQTNVKNKKKKKLSKKRKHEKKSKPFRA